MQLLIPATILHQTCKVRSPTIVYIVRTFSGSFGYGVRKMVGASPVIYTQALQDIPHKGQLRAWESMSSLMAHAPADPALRAIYLEQDEPIQGPRRPTTEEWQKYRCQLPVPLRGYGDFAFAGVPAGRIIKRPYTGWRD